jgi:fructose-bisphosphate aldolase class II
MPPKTVTACRPSTSITWNKYAGEPYLRHLIEAAIETHPDIPIVMHQDHGASPSICIQSMRSGFSSVMMDGSLQEDAKTPASFEYNARVSRHVVDIAHAIGVSVEGELGCLGSLETGMGEKEDGHGAEGALSHDQLLTDVNEAADFVKATGVDALAIAIGTSHGAYKFTRPPTGAVLRIDRIKEIHARIPNTHLVMHGSSSVPQDWLKIINQYGGTMGETYGVPVEDIKHGVRKINIDTDLRMASTGAIRKYLAENPKDFDPRKYLAVARKAMKEICVARYTAFGCAGQAAKIKPISMDKMAERYKKGELNAIVK